MTTFQDSGAGSAACVPVTSGSVRLLYAYRIISRFYFHLPVLFVLFYGRHWSLPVVEALLAAYGAAVALTAGAGPRLTRAIGPRRTVAAGEACKAAGLMLLAASSSMPAAVAGQVLGGVGFSLSTGPDTGLLAALVPDTARRARHQASMQSWMFLSVLVSGVLGSMIFSHSSRLVLCLSAGAALTAMAIVLLIAEPRTSLVTVSAAPPERSHGTGSWWWSTYYVIGRAATLAPFVGILPFIYFVRLHVNLPVFGTVLGLFTLSAFCSARYVPNLTRMLPASALAVAALTGTGLSLALFGLFPTRLAVALAAIALLGMFSGCIRPLAMTGLDGAGVTPAAQVALAGRLEQYSGLVSTMVLLASGFLLPDGLTVLLFGIASTTLAAALLLAARKALPSAPAP